MSPAVDALIEFAYGENALQKLIVTGLRWLRPRGWRVRLPGSLDL